MRTVKLTACLLALLASTGLFAAAAPPPAAGAPNKAAVTGALQPTSPQTFDTKQRALVERVSTYLSGLQTLVGDFVQVGPDGNRTEGQFYIQKPGKVRFEYNPPAKIDVDQVQVNQFPHVCRGGQGQDCPT